MEGNQQNQSTEDQFVYRPDTQVQPGAQISPVTVQQPSPQVPAQQPQQIAQTVAAPIQPSSITPEIQQPLTTPTPPDDPNAITWTASEYIHYQKTAGWYTLLLVAGVVLAAAAYFLMSDFTAPIVILMLTAVVWVYGSKQPRTLNYQLSPNGLLIEDKLYDFSKFRSFSVHQEGNIYSLSLSPMQRFMPQMSIYFSESDGENIVGTISMYLPHEDREPDAFERLSSRLRF